MAVLAPPPPPPPAIEQPASFQVSYGVVSGRVAAGTRRIIVRAGGRTLADRRLRGRRFEVRVGLPLGETSVRVVGVDARGRRSGRTVTHVYGLPRAAEPRVRASRLDSGLARTLRRLVRAYPGTAGVYVQSLTTGDGAAWNARARFPAASTLKLAIAIAVLARDGGPPPQRASPVDGLLRRMLTYSDNAAANALETWLAGSTSAGSHRIMALLRGLGISETLMYGGYELDRRPSGAIPLRIEQQPRWGYGKYTTVNDLAAMLRAVWLASGGRGVLRAREPGFAAADARYLLYLLAHVRDRGKLDRGLPAGVRVLHKAGWLEAARHDNGLVFWRGGVFVAAVMTWRPAGPGVAADVLTGTIARAALERFRG
jgi:beta-lactamase class A